MAKLTDKEAQVVWKRIDCARRWVKNEVHPDMKRACELYAGQHWPDQKSKASQARIVYNILYPAVETKVANLSFAYPDFVMKPMNQEGADHSDVARHVISYDWRQASAQSEMRRALRDREIYGVGVTYDYWLWETEPVDGKAGVRVEGGRPAEALEPEDTTPDLFGIGPVTEEPQYEVRTDRPAVKRLRPCDFYVSPECDAVLDNATFCGFSELRPLEEVRADKRFKNTRNLKGSADGLKHWMDEKDRDLDDEEKPSDQKRVLLIHYFERNRKIHAIYAEEGQKLLMVEPWRWDGDWYPFVVQRTPDEEDRFFPTPSLLRVEHQQLEINESRTQHSQWRKQASPKFQYPGSSLDTKQRQAVSSGRAGTVVEDVVGSGLIPLPTPPLQKEVLEAGNMAMGDLRFACGLNDYETATPPTKRMTAPEVEAVRMGGGARGVADRQAFEMACSELASHFLAWEQQYSVRTRNLPIFDENEQLTGFRDYTREEIAGEFLVEVAVGSTTAPKNDAILEQISFLLQSLPGFIQALPMAQQVGLDLRLLLPKLLKAALPDLRDVEQALLQQLTQPPPMDPMAAMMAGSPPMEGVMPGMEEAPPSPDSALGALLAERMGAGLGG